MKYEVWPVTLLFYSSLDNYKNSTGTNINIRDYTWVLLNKEVTCTGSASAVALTINNITD